jgi:hypothetical protein
MVSRGTHGVFAYMREYEKKILCIALNFTKNTQTLNAGHRGQWKILFSTHRTSYEHFTSLHFKLYPFEASLIEKIGEL